MIDFYSMRDLMRRVDRAYDNLRVIQSRATRVTPVLTGMPRGGSTSDMVGDGAVDAVKARQAYEGLKGQLRQMQSELLPRLAEIENPLYREILRKRYIECKSVTFIAIDAGYSREGIYRILRQCEQEINDGRKVHE